MPTLRLIAIPQGTHYVSTIDADEPVSKNDFRVRILGDANIGGLTDTSDFTITGGDLVADSFEGENSVFEIGIRPPETGSGDIVLTLAEDAVTDGNAEVSLTIAYADSRADAVWGEVFSDEDENYTGILEATPNRIYLTRGANIDAFEVDGDEVTTERRTLANDLDYALPYGNNGYLVWNTDTMELLDADGNSVWESDTLKWMSGNTEAFVNFEAWTLTRDGILVVTGNSVIRYTFAEINEAVRLGDTALATDRRALSFDNGDVTVPSNIIAIASDIETDKIYVVTPGKTYPYNGDREILESEIFTNNIPTSNTEENTHSELADQIILYPDGHAQTTQSVGYDVLSSIQGFTASSPVMFRVGGEANTLFGINTDVIVGSSATIEFTYTIGGSTQTQTLTFTDSGSFTSVQTFTLPTGARITSVTIDGWQNIPGSNNVRRAYVRATYELTVGLASRAAVHNGVFYELPNNPFVEESDLYTYDVQSALAPKAHTNIYPIHARPDESIDLYKLFDPFIAQDDGIVALAVGFDLPDWLSARDDRYLDIADTVTDRKTAYISCNGINTNGISETLRFYLIVEPLPAPSWLETHRLCMYEDQTLNLLEFVEDADVVDWKSGFSVPSELDITDSKFTVTGTLTQVSYSLELTATKGSLSTDQTLSLFILAMEASAGTLSGHKVEIEGIDVSEHRRGNIRLSQSLDANRVNEYKIGTCTIVLALNHESDESFVSRLDPNFWTANDLNYGGYLNAVSVYAVYREDTPNATPTDRLIFSGVITNSTENIDNNTVTLSCRETTSLIRQLNLKDTAIGIRKYVALEESSDASDFEGVYAIDSGLSPALIAPDTVSAFTDRTAITLKDVVNRVENVRVDNTGHWTGSAVRTQGGLLAAPPLLFCKVPFRKKSIGFGLRTLVMGIAAVCGTKTEISEGLADDPYTQAFGNFVYDTEPGRTERMPVDWIHDPTGNALYILLSNPSNRVRDRLIRFDIDDEMYRVLHEFDADRSVHEITSSNFDDFYITTAAAIDVDRSDPNPTRREPASAYLGYDAASAFSDTRIVEFNQTSDTETEIVGSSATYPPQIGLHYWAGFSNPHYLYSWEGIQPESRCNFKVHSSELYYRYATTSAFGVAKRATDGTITTLFSKTHDPYFNYINFDFDIDDDGEVYLASVDAGTLTLEKYVSGGTNEEVFSVSTHTDLGSSVFLGVHELKVEGDNFYMIVPLQASGAPYEHSGGAAVLEWDGTDLHLLDTSDFVQWGPYGLTPHGDKVYFTETPAVSYRLLPINPNLDGWDADDGYNDLSNNKGTLKSITSAHAVDSHGNNYFEDEPFRGTYVRGLSFNDGLHYIFGYGDPQRIQQPTSPLRLPENLQWCGFQRRIRYTFDVLYGSRNLTSEILKYALQTHSAFFNDRGILNLRDIRPISARLTATIGTTIAYAGANRAFPESGYVYVDGEVIRYEARTDTELQTLSRAQFGTAQTSAGDETEFLYIDRTHPELVGDLSFPQQTSEYFNVVEDSEGLIRLKDDETTLPEKVYSFSTGLSEHDVPWIEVLSEIQLNRLSNIRNRVSFAIGIDYMLRLGHILYFRYGDDISDSVRVIQIEHQGERTRVVGRSVEPSGVQ